MTLRQRITEWADRRTVEADAEATAHGLNVQATTRYRRTYSDSRIGALRAAREGGCVHVPAHLTVEDCPLAVHLVKETV